ncbi:MAG: hypothetical protein Q7J69_01090 [Candidatus Omnitrophota bacterium]|nr:hypothetical protein [Candidatus Omnitrophota bacterium]
MNKRWVMGMAMALSLGGACPAMAATSLPEPEKELTEKMEKQMLEFVRNNYPHRMTSAVRSMQNQESKLRKTLTEAAQFFEGFAVGPVRMEGRWEGTGCGARYMLLSVVRGVQNYPNATVSFKTYPGLFRPFTVVQVDADSDGKVEEQSTALCKREKMLEWLSERFPQAVCLVRKK